MPKIPKEELEVLRNQLEVMIRFMAATPLYESYMSADWWIGETPACPSAYNPYIWERSKDSMDKMWGEYLYELKRFDPDRLADAKALQITDLGELLAFDTGYTIFCGNYTKDGWVDGAVQEK